ncbi:MAG: hypothetical protein JXR76_02710 [Deltaproteobacteria bacterium]|nr:hypothetical protein [Deltaproteobacteria bacterium]
MFESLKLGDFILLVLGGILFFVLTGLLIFCVVKQRPYRFILGSFILPIVMIGFPAIQIIDFKNGLVIKDQQIADLEKTMAKNPTGDDVLEQANQLISEIESNPEAVNSPEVQKQIRRLQTVKEMAVVAREVQSDDVSAVDLDKKLKRLESGSKNHAVNSVGMVKVRDLVAQKAVTELKEEKDLIEKDIQRNNAPPAARLKKTAELVKVIESSKRATQSEDVSKLLRTAKSIRDFQPRDPGVPKPPPNLLSDEKRTTDSITIDK